MRKNKSDLKMVPFLSMLLFYLSIILFLYYTFRNNKPLNWNIILNGFTFNFRQDDEILRIPGPLRLPFVGTKWTQLVIKMNKLHEFYAKMHETYGDIVLEMSGNIPVVSLYNRLDIEKVLKFPSKHPFRPETEIISYFRRSHPERYPSTGLVNMQGHEWARLRALLATKTIENRKCLKRSCPDLNEMCDDFIADMRRKRNDANVIYDVHDSIKTLSVDATFSLILGKRLKHFHNGKEKLEELKLCVNNIFKSFRDSTFGLQLWKYFPTKLYKEFGKNETRVYEITSEIIRETLQKEDIRRPETENDTILVTILKAKELEHGDKICGVVDFLSAGVDVFAHTVCFLLHHLSDKPEVQERIYEEVMNMDDDPTHEDFSRFHYTRAAIHESYRLTPVAHALARVIEENTSCSGYLLKPGTVVLCQTMVASSKEDNFEDSLSYKPERWLQENGEFDPNITPGSIVVSPFGTGRRICPGKKFVDLLLIIFLTKLVKAFRISYLSEFDREFEYLVAPKRPVNIQFHDRD
ncbi:CLUMA_CG012599, isoform A [Clunio marinus]|uniref:CLUMA_CG012599, isoform A n=1 Tax=Clunio marinus TaxID=568069 RepID=A0A1J1IGF1_9DIPT|nr:CLUMA_CG012599, isoform A [Clunio marinus]